jgi:autotransporter-associated beta strand protein
VRSRKLIVGWAALGALAGIAPTARAANASLRWDADPNAAGVQGVGGPWNSVNANWQNAAQNNVQWSNGAGDTAVFDAGPGGQITLQSARSAAGIQVDAAGYTIGVNSTSSSAFLTLSSGSISASVDVTVAAPLTSTGGLTKWGAGVLTLTANNNVIGGPVTINGGAVSFAEEGHLGSTQNDVNLSGGGRLRYSGASGLSLAAGRLVTVGATGGGIETPGSDLLLTAGQLAGTGVLTKSGAGVLRLRWPAAAANGFAGTARVAAGELRLLHALAINARPVELAAGTLALRGDQSTPFGSAVTVTGDAALTVNRNLDNAFMLKDHAIGSLAVAAGVTLAVSSASQNYLTTGGLTLAGNVRIDRSAVRVTGAFAGAGAVTFGGQLDAAELFASGLIFDNGASQVMANAVLADPATDGRAVVAAGGAGTVVDYRGAWQSGGGSATAAVALRDGGQFVLGAAARVNTLTADRLAARPFTIVGHGGASDAFDVDAGFVADHTQGGTLADGFGGLELRDATLVTRATASLPVVTKMDGFGGTHRAGLITFSGTAGARWRAIAADQQYDGGVTVGSNATIEVATKLTHAGGVGAKFDGQFQIPAGGVTLSKEEAGWLVLAGAQGYAAGATLDVKAGGVRFESDPGQGYYAGNFSRGATGDVVAPPAATGTLAVVASGEVEFAAPVSRVASVQVKAGGVARVANTPTPGQRTVVTKALSIAGDGQVDVGNGRIVVDYDGAASSFSDVAALVKKGLNVGGPRWQGAGGIVSGLAGDDATLGVGYGEAAAVLRITGNQTKAFGGATVDATSVLIRFTRLGDANLDGVVSFEDLQRLELGFGGAGGWTDGDFNYDGVVNRADLAIVEDNMGLKAPLFVEANQSATDVPEPMGVGWVGLGAWVMGRRAGRRTRSMG